MAIADIVIGFALQGLLAAGFSLAREGFALRAPQRSMARRG